eukprot:gnl/MRDRNA2_/MRDRNA2_32529_c0_seq1.p1 gnl/MRDRNA2_/MRDRNA2_32529_c0~~gnl/MRDRNA2_/MRDRNA2_32529_c0_seq1.p1  ORF type:complete len:106 (-),score=15.70 gnl/MRDRNA2_/MRDRNA2_32529_c0_seq1:30-347(-)
MDLLSLNWFPAIHEATTTPAPTPCMNPAPPKPVHIQSPGQKATSPMRGPPDNEGPTTHAQDCASSLLSRRAGAMLVCHHLMHSVAAVLSAFQSSSTTWNRSPPTQ